MTKILPEKHENDRFVVVIYISILFVIAQKGNVLQILSFTDWYNDLEEEIWLAIDINVSWAFVALKRNV